MINTNYPQSVTLDQLMKMPKFSPENISEYEKIDRVPFYYPKSLSSNDLPNVIYIPQRNFSDSSMLPAPDNFISDNLRNSILLDNISSRDHLAQRLISHSEDKPLKPFKSTQLFRAATPGRKLPPLAIEKKIIHTGTVLPIESSNITSVTQEEPRKSSKTSLKPEKSKWKPTVGTAPILHTRTRSDFLIEKQRLKKFSSSKEQLNLAFNVVNILQRDDMLLKKNKSHMYDETTNSIEMTQYHISKNNSSNDVIQGKTNLGDSESLKTLNESHVQISIQENVTSYDCQEGTLPAIVSENNDKVEENMNLKYSQSMFHAGQLNPSLQSQVQDSSWALPVGDNIDDTQHVGKSLDETDALGSNFGIKEEISLWNAEGSTCMMLHDLSLSLQEEDEEWYTEGMREKMKQNLSPLKPASKILHEEKENPFIDEGIVVSTSEINKHHLSIEKESKENVSARLDFLVDNSSLKSPVRSTAIEDTEEAQIMKIEEYDIENTEEEQIHEDSQSASASHETSHSVVTMFKIEKSFSSYPSSPCDAPPSPSSLGRTPSLRQSSNILHQSFFFQNSLFGNYSNNTAEFRANGLFVPQPLTLTPSSSCEDSMPTLEERTLNLMRRDEEFNYSEKSRTSFKLKKSRRKQFEILSADDSNKLDPSPERSRQFQQNNEDRSNPTLNDELNFNSSDSLGDKGNLEFSEEKDFTDSYSENNSVKSENVGILLNKGDGDEVHNSFSPPISTLSRASSVYSNSIPPTSRINTARLLFDNRKPSESAMTLFASRIHSKPLSQPLPNINSANDFFEGKSINEIYKDNRSLESAELINNLSVTQSSTLYSNPHHSFSALLQESKLELNNVLSSQHTTFNPHIKNQNKNQSFQRFHNRQILSERKEHIQNTTNNFPSSEIDDLKSIQIQYQEFNRSTFTRSNVNNLDNLIPVSPLRQTFTAERIHQNHVSNPVQIPNEMIYKIPAAPAFVPLTMRKAIANSDRLLRRAATLKSVIPKQAASHFGIRQEMNGLVRSASFVLENGWKGRKKSI